jgi:hypothetical protein
MIQEIVTPNMASGYAISKMRAMHLLAVLCNMPMFAQAVLGCSRQPGTGVTPIHPVQAEAQADA